MAEILTHAAFYAGWPKAWAAFRMAKEVWTENADSTRVGSLEGYAQTIIFPVGKPNDAYAKYFIGQSYVAPVVTAGRRSYAWEVAVIIRNGEKKRSNCDPAMPSTFRPA